MATDEQPPLAINLNMWHHTVSRIHSYFLDFHRSIAYGYIYDVV